MSQDDINELEWRNPLNWTWRGPLGFYFSKRDTRLVVPKAVPGMGITLNFFHPMLNYALAAILIFPIAIFFIQYLFLNYY